MNKFVALFVGLFILLASAYAIVPGDVSRTAAVVDGHLGHQTLPGVPVWPNPNGDTVTLSGQVDNLSAQPSSYRITWNDNDIDYGDMTWTQLDSDSWTYEFVIVPNKLGEYELYVGNSGGEVRVNNFWCFFT